MSWLGFKEIFFKVSEKMKEIQFLEKKNRSSGKNWIFNKNLKSSLSSGSSYTRSCKVSNKSVERF